MNRQYVIDRIRLLTLGASLVAIVILGGCAWIWYAFIYDEGVRLAQQIAREANVLRASPETRREFTFRPLLGVHQAYSIEIAAGPQCRPTCDPPVGLAVTVEHGHSGFTSYHRRFVSVPQHLQVKENGTAAQITLSKKGSEIQVVELR